ncbi:hypothetical protein EDD86DRAFT_249285 [Gorgonomyces haynaldii]|nr:hypothetical protein EDD86DRAFT_249285 [Gorgonomyces haynaldii]
MDQLRRKQIQSLQDNHIVYRINGNAYEIPCNVGQAQLVLKMVFPPGFPQEAPQISVQNCQHPWIVNDRIVFPFQSWTVNTSLGRIVKEILAEFALHPPTVTAEFTLTTAERPNRQPPPVPVDRISLLIDTKSSLELEHLIEDKPSRKKLLQSITQVQEWKKVIQDLLNENALVAEQTMHAAQQVEKSKIYVSELSQRFSKEQVQARLKERVKQLERESDEIVEHFVNGELTETDFVQQFRKKRQDYHLNAIRQQQL